MNRPEKQYSSEAILREISGSMGNFGTVLPIVLGAALVSEVGLGPAHLFFGLRYIVMGIHCGIPMSFKPRKFKFVSFVFSVSMLLSSANISESGRTTCNNLQ